MKAAIPLVVLLSAVSAVRLTMKKAQPTAANTTVARASFADVQAARQEIAGDYTTFVNTIQKASDRSPLTFDFLPPGTRCGFHWMYPQHTASLTIRSISVTDNKASTDIDLTTSYVTGGAHGPAMPAGSRLILHFSERDQWTKTGGRWILTKGEPIEQTQATLNGDTLPPNIPPPGTGESLFFPAGSVEQHVDL